MKKSAAFTLVEIMLVVAILGIITLEVVSNYTKSSQTQELVSQAEQFADILRRAHIFSRELKDDKAWGVSSTDQVSYALYSKDILSTISEDTRVTLPTNVSFTAIFDLLFQRNTGYFVDLLNPPPVNIYLQNKQGRQIKIIIFETGIVDVVPL